MKPKRYLIVRPDRIGDVMTATGIPRAVKEKDPDSFVGFLAKPGTKPLLYNNPSIDCTIIDTGSFWGLVRKIRRGRFDCAVLLVQSMRHTWAVRLAGVPQRYGLGGKPYERICGIRGLGRKERGIRHHGGADILGLAGIHAAALKPELHLTPQESEEAGKWLHQSGLSRSRKRIGMQITHGGSSANWPVEKWIELIRSLCGRGYAVLANAPEVPSPAKERVAKDLGKDAFGWMPFGNLRELAGLISCCDVFVAPNTGPLHMAAGLGVPAIGLYCPLPGLDPTAWALPGEVPVLPANGVCEPCPGPRACSMNAIEMSDVVKMIEKVVGSTD